MENVLLDLFDVRRGFKIITHFDIPARMCRIRVSSRNYFGKDLFKSINILLRGGIKGLQINVQRTITKEVTMFMAPSTMEGYVIVIKGFHPFIILLNETY